MDEENREFAQELIKKYGSDRFYHSCLRTSDVQTTLRIYFNLNEHDDFKCSEFMRDIGIYVDEFLFKESALIPKIQPTTKVELSREDARFHLCRIAFGFCLNWRELGLRTPELPAHIQSRMILGESNQWVENYALIIQKMRANNNRL
jgi:hypothetical protein